jgi:4-amino-4-deoxy-L-arabinose transferase-like glycosyltransferase
MPIEPEKRAEPVSIAPLPAPTEDHPRLWLVFPILIVLTVMIGYLCWSYFVPAHAGTDQNGYLTTARLILEEHRLSFIPDNPFQFAGRMMIVTPEGWIYAKYPFGYPLLATIARYFKGPDAMFAVNPLCTAAACFFSFFLFRSVLGNFASLMGVIWMALNPVALVYANEANSHAPTLLCVVIGFWGLLTWWQKGGAWRGFIGGFALGYACTIRYTEFLLVLPILAATVDRAKFKLRELPNHLAALIGWAIPIAALAIVLWVSFGAPWTTGYSFCKEQTGFGLKYLLGPDDDKQGNWATLLYQLNHTGMFLLWPAALAGMLGLFGQSKKLAMILALWIVPSTFLYLCYYWAPTGEQTTGYLRFFLTIFPGMVLCGLWLLDRGLNISRLTRAVSLGALTVLGAAINIDNISPQLENSLEGRAALWLVGQGVQKNIPKGSVIFADQQLNNYLDELGGWKLYELQMFDPRTIDQYRKQMTTQQDDDPNPIQRTRADAYVKLLGIQNADGTYRPRPAHELDREQLKIVEEALAQNKRVYYIFSGGGPSRNMLGGRKDLQARRVALLDPPPRPQASDWQTRFRAGRLVNKQAAQNAQQRKQRSWTIYEVVREDK